MKKDLCPVWVGYLLACPLRKLFQNPGKILQPYIKEGMTVMDIGSAMGFFSFPAVRLAGESGRVICIDLQEQMLTALKKRAKKKGLDGRIETVRCSETSLNIGDYAGSVDVALTIAMVHEVPSPENLFAEVRSVMKPGGILLLAEPKGHVSAEDFQKTLVTAQGAGFKPEGHIGKNTTHSAVLKAVLLSGKYAD